MRLLCTGDFHIGAGAEYGPRPGDRLRDQAEVLARIAELAAAEHVDAVLFAGDAVERRSPAPAELIVWRSFVDQLVEARIPLIAISGNHDVAAADLPTGMEVVDECYRTPRLVEIGPLENPVFVATLPWVPPARLVATRGGGDRDELHAEAAQLLLESARDLRAQIPQGRSSILLAHWSVSGAVTPNGADVGLFREPVLPLSDLEQLGFDAIVLGHIHKPQTLDDPWRIFYVGSPMVLNFGEADSSHGVWLLDTDDGARFIPIEDRPFVTVDADLNAIFPGTDETDYIAALIAEHFPLTDAVVRLRYRATAEQARRVDHAALRGLVADAGASKLYSIAPEIVRSERARVAGVDEQVEPLAAVELWIENQGIESPGPLRSLTSRYLEEAAA